MTREWPSVSSPGGTLNCHAWPGADLDVFGTKITARIPPGDRLTRTDYP